MSYIKERVCLDCGKIEIIRKDSTAIRCKSCSAKISNKKALESRKSKMTFKKCIGCDNTFSISKKWDFCSVECSSKSKHTQRVCKHCDKEFEILKCKLKTNATGDFCSKECYSNHLKTINGEQHRCYNRVDKQCEQCGKDLKIIPSRAEGNNYCSQKCRVKSHGAKTFGEKNCNWKGGHKNRKGNFEQVKSKYFSGINFCSLCGTSKKIHIHHIVPFRYTGDNSFNNLIPLCSKCHRKVEGITWKMIDTGIDYPSLKILMSSSLRHYQLLTYTKLRTIANER